MTDRTCVPECKLPCTVDTDAHDHPSNQPDNMSDWGGSTEDSIYMLYIHQQEQQERNIMSGGAACIKQFEPTAYLHRLVMQTREREPRQHRHACNKSDRRPAHSKIHFMLQWHRAHSDGTGLDLSTPYSPSFPAILQCWPQGS